MTQAEATQLVLPLAENQSAFWFWPLSDRDDAEKTREAFVLLTGKAWFLVESQKLDLCYIQDTDPTLETK